MEPETIFSMHLRDTGRLKESCRDDHLLAYLLRIRRIDGNRAARGFPCADDGVEIGGAWVALSGRRAVATETSLPGALEVLSNREFVCEIPVPEHRNLAAFLDVAAAIIAVVTLV